MTKKLWGGRFSKDLHPEAMEFTSSLNVDEKLAEYDVIGSIAHAKMLAKCKIISNKDKDSLVKALNTILNSIKRGAFKPSSNSEDIHTAIYEALQKKAGKAADKLHTARSRNDQVSLDVRLYLKDEIKALIALLASAQKSLLNFSKKNVNVAVPGYTHMKHAQVIILAHWALAYIEMLQRDKERLHDGLKRIDVLPLGACAFCGTSLPIDRKHVAKLLGFLNVSENSIDSVSDRDFVIEVISALAILAMHLSRFAEDAIFYGSDESGFLDVDEAFCTGSSIMPHKKNLDTLELIRARSATIYGNLMASLTMMKALPTSYNRDMQLDKEMLIGSVEMVKKSLSLAAKLISGIKVNREKIAKQLEDEFLYATDLAEALIEKGFSQSEAHQTIGKLVTYCVDKQKKISGLDNDELKKFSLDEGIKKLLDPLTSADAKSSFGATSRKNVKRQIIVWERKLKDA